MLNKIGVVGGGNIGGVLVQEIVTRKLARNVALVDVKEPNFAEGKCLDIAEGAPVIGSDVNVEGSKDYSVVEGSDIIINTAGVPRTTRPDGTIPSREELLVTNLKITDLVSDGISKYASKAIIISIANPLDAIVYRLQMNLNRDRKTIMGMAGVLDSARYRLFIAREADVSIENVEALVLGGHGDDMLPVRSACRIAGMPVTQFVSEDKLEAIETRTRKAGGEVVKLLGSGSAFVSPAWSALQMTEAIAYNSRKIMPVCTMLKGEYGVDGLFIGVPAILGRNGIEGIIEMDLSDSEKEMFKKSIASVQKTADEVIALTS